MKKNELSINLLPQNTKLLTVQDVADMLNMSIWYVYRRVNDGSLRVIKMGRSNRFLLVDVENFLKERHC